MFDTISWRLFLLGGGGVQGVYLIVYHYLLSGLVCLACLPGLKGDGEGKLCG